MSSSTDTLKDVPEFFETEIKESTNARTAALSTFKELGPPDLCQITKQPVSSRSSTKELGSYHYVSGVDASSSASLAAYLNSLTYSMATIPTWLGGKSRQDWKITQGVYCCYNAFSHVDVRVEVKIPGSVDTYVIDGRGEKHQPTPQIWTEVYLSAVLRSIHYADDNQYHLVGYRKLDPIKTPEDELRFLAAAEQCFHMGWQLGSDPEVQMPTLVTNHLTSGIMKYFGGLGKWEPAINLFEKMYTQNAEVGCLLAEAYIGMNEEIKAVQILHAGLEANPLSHTLLHVQCDFLRSKGKLEWALQLAQKAVNCAPSEFNTWAKLTELNIETKRYADAMRSLNSCPMYAINDKDLHMPMATRSNFPVKQFIADANMLDEESARDTEADPNLLRLAAPQLRGTYAKAYVLLARMASLVGWDELLKCRSQVFVMEEEYRMHKLQENKTNASDVSINGQDNSSSQPNTATATSNETSNNNNNNNNQQNGTNPDIVPINPAENESSAGIPTIKVSAESDDEQDNDENQDNNNNNDDDENDDDNDNKNDNISSNAEQDQRPSLDGPVPGVNKPDAAAAPPEQQQQQQDDEQQGKDGLGISENGDQDQQQDQQQQNHESQLDQQDESSAPASSGSFVNKRLCERWLDLLFMDLYEDLRVYTVWRAEIRYCKAQRIQYQKTGTEWEILGDLAQRLHHKEEAKDAYERCLGVKFSPKSWMKLIEYYADEGDVQRALYASAPLAAHQHRWYYEASFPSSLATHLFKCVRQVGLSKVNAYLTSMNLPSEIHKLVQGYLNVAVDNHIEGSEL